MDLGALRQRCTELAGKQQWEQVEAICEQVLASRELPPAERAAWLFDWAIWSYEESISGGRVLYWLARSLLDEAIPLAKTDPGLLGRIYVTQTAVCYGPAVEQAARRFWRLRAQHPELLDPNAGHVHFNLGFKACSYVGALGVQQVRRAAPTTCGQHSVPAASCAARRCTTTPTCASTLGGIGRLNGPPGRPRSPLQTLTGISATCN